MKLPPNVTENDFVVATDKIVNLLAHSFKFGYYEAEDIKQQARLFAIEAMERYDPTRPLDNFLYSHVKNRLINFRRDKFRRNDPPCLDCHNSLPGETRHEDRQYCEKYIIWFKRNATKQNIMNPLDLGNISDEQEANTRVESSVLDDIEIAELKRMIDVKLPIELRTIYLQMLDPDTRSSVPKAKRLLVERAIQEIVGESLECLVDSNADD
jgi:DNA-directed RNA polymerase specialized sigma24 family protein